MIMEKSKKERIEKNQTTVNYYIIQCVASILLLRIIMTKEIRQEAKIVIGIMILIIKIGVWPFHIWYLKVLSELKIKSRPFLIIVTWQKIIPVIIIITIIRVKNYEIIVILVINMMTIVTILKKKTSVKSLIILSSGFNNSLIICSSMRASLIVIFIRIYSISVILALRMIRKIKKKRINPRKQTIREAIITANLGGLPPFMLFFGKIIVIKNLLAINIIELRFLIIVIICAFMYHYYWVISPRIIEITRKTQIQVKRNMRRLTNTLLIISSIRALTVIILGLTKRIYLDRVKIKNL